MLYKKFFALIILAAMIFVPVQLTNAQTTDTSLSILWVQNLEDADSWGEGYEGDGIAGKGVLIDKERKLAVTARTIARDAHFVFVSFPAPFNAPDASIENDPDHYRYDYLERIENGDGCWARVIAKDSHRDLAILQLDRIPEEAIAISQDATAVPAAGDTLHLLNNSFYETTDTWNWEEGEVDKVELGWIHVDPYPSKESIGGPVINEDGDLVGINVFAGQRTGSSRWNRVWVAPISAVEALLDTIKLRPTVRVKNLEPKNTTYDIKWSSGDAWSKKTLSPGGAGIHWTTGSVQSGYPQIRVDSHDGIPPEGPQFLEKVPFSVEASKRYFGDGYTNDFRYDAYTYDISVNTSTKERNVTRSSNGCVALDVNRDGETNIDDLKFIASHLHSASPPVRVDAYPNKVVDTYDIIYAAGLECDVANAPSVLLVSSDRNMVSVDQSLESVLPLSSVPAKTALLANYPNPFNPETWLPYQLAESAQVTMRIYGADGRLVRMLVLGHQVAGMYSDRSSAAYWDGRNETGETVASGLYFYTLTAGDFSATRKMLIAK